MQSGFSIRAPLALLFVFIVARWFPELTAGDLHDDEQVYFTAFAAVAEGRSPYGAGYLYPPIFAHAGATLLEAVGPRSLVLGMRLANLAGLAMLLWLGLSAIQDRRLRWLLAALVAGLSPAVDIAVRWGNITPAVAALLVTSVLLLDQQAQDGLAPDEPAPDGRSGHGQIARRPATAFLRGTCGALALAAGILIKPLAAVVPVLLLLPTPRPDGSRRIRAPMAALAALGLMACGLLMTPGLAEFLSLGDSPRRSGLAGQNVSILRLLYVLGLELSPLTVVLLVLVLAFSVWVRILRIRGLDRWQWLSYLSVATLLATPIVWNHTTLVALPVQAGALAIWLGRRHGAPWWEGGLVILAVLSQHLSAGVGGVGMQTPGPLAVAIAVPALAPLFLLAYQLLPGPRRPIAKTRPETSPK